MTTDNADNDDDETDNAHTITLSEMNAFAYTIAHDLKAPLRAMNAFAEALEEDYSQVLDDEGRQYLAHITDGARTMSVMIDDLMSYSRIGQGNFSLGIEDIGDLVDSVLEKAADPITASGANIHIASPLPKALVNRDSFITLLSHLVGNSIKFAKPGTKPEVSISGEINPEVFELVVADNGIGIDPELTDRIFKLFLRLEPNSGLGGTGVGLAAVEKIVRLHGGTVSVSMSPQGGTIFKVSFPQA